MKESLSDIFNNALHGKNVEPEQRLVGGQYGLAVHRLPIKGGISRTQVLIKQLDNTEALFKRLSERVKQ